MITALIDGDWILYAAGFAGQKSKFIYAASNGYGPVLIYGDNVTEVKTLCEKVAAEFATHNLYKREELDPEEFFYHSAKKMIETQCLKIAEKFNDEVKPHVMIDGDGNFRSRLATIKPYKGTRSAHSKPLMFNGIRQYLLDVWNAEVIFDQETDDALAIRQTAAAANKEKTIIVGVDKDLLQVPGWHLNPNKGFKRITPGEGELLVYRQAAMGDATDNIAGAYKVGPKAAEAAFNPTQNEDHKWRILVDLYQGSIDKHGNQYKGLSAEQAALENMRLVYLRRTEGEALWLPPNQRS